MEHVLNVEFRRQLLQAFSQNEGVEMKFDILSVRDPVWSNSTNTQIDCTIRTSAYSEGLPFTASPNDLEAHGREIFNRCLNGEFGEIGPYEPSAYKECEETRISLPRWTIAWPEVHEFLTEANAENARNSPRAIALVW